MGEDEAFGLLWYAVAVTIIHTLKDWRGIELWLLMEFLQLWICELKFTFAYRKRCSMYPQHAVGLSAGPNMFLTKGLMETKDIHHCFFCSYWVTLMGFCFSYAKHLKPLSDFQVEQWEPCSLRITANGGTSNPLNPCQGITNGNMLTV